jgi:hypothetical protein
MATILVENEQRRKVRERHPYLYCMEIVIIPLAATLSRSSCGPLLWNRRDRCQRRQRWSFTVRTLKSPRSQPTSVLLKKGKNQGKVLLIGVVDVQGGTFPPMWEEEDLSPKKGAFR